MKPHVILAAFAFCTPLVAQNLVPELAPLSQAHRTASENLAAQKVTELARARQSYFAALNTADKNATAAGNAAALRAIAKEREALEKGRVRTAMPDDLPKNLSPARKAMFTAVEHTTEDFDKKQKSVDAEYLRKIATLQPKADGDFKLASQIASEKQRLLAGINGPISDLTTGLAGTKWRISEGKGTEEFIFGSEGKVNGTWKYVVLARDKVRVIWNPKSVMMLTLRKDGRSLGDGSRVWTLLQP